MGNLTEDFSLSDFACKDGTPVPPEFHENAARLARNLQALRDRLGECVHINSAFRTQRHNRTVGGVDGSQHVLCTAVDIYVDSLSASELRDAIETLISEGAMDEGGVGMYKDFVHYDMRGERARW